MSSSVLLRISDQGAQLLLVSAETGDLKECQRLLALGINPKSAKGRNDFSALHYAASRGHIGIINALLQCGMDVDMRSSDGETPLHVAAYAGQFLVVEQLLDYNAD